jgi:hypothetical protein
MILGTIGIPGNDFVYKLIKRDNLQSPLSVSSDSNGDLWIIIGI